MDICTRCEHCRSYGEQWGVNYECQHPTNIERSVVHGTAYHIHSIDVFRKKICRGRFFTLKCGVIGKCKTKLIKLIKFIKDDFYEQR